MGLIDRIILKYGEKALLPFRGTQYAENLSEIENCYEQAAYWHGTGRYQYARAQDSRYGDISFEGTSDILASILHEGGLRPHDEPWLKKMQNAPMPTVSMTPFRMYARLYAGLYLYEKDALAYEFGTTKTWFRILMAVQVLDRRFIWSFLTKGLFKLARPSSYRNAQVWIRSIRSDKDGKPVRPFTFKGHLLRTDIPGNYPLLIGIQKGVSTIPLNPLISRLEVRTTDPILLKDITHIEVPLSKVQETKDFLRQANVQLEVIPLEFGEACCSKRKLVDLIT